jgi:predicted ATP-grasp superfamily ATP-dependent carboligase
VLEISRQSLPSELRCVLLEDNEAWEAFQHRYHQYLPDLLIQKYIHGNSADMVSIGLYADENSTIKGLFVGRKIRGFPPFFGDTRAGQNFLVDETILKQVEESVAALKYRGLAEFEYKIDKNSGQFSLIEINPRSWSWIGVTPASSADIPWIAYQDLTGIETEKAWCNSNPGTIKYVRLLNDFVDVTLRNRWGYPAWAMSPRQWWRSLEAETLVIAEFGRRDWSLAFWSPVYFVASIASSLWRRIKNRLRRLKTQDVSVKASAEL